MKLTLTILLSSILFISCFNKLKKNEALADKVSIKFETKDVEVFQGIASGDDGTHPFIDISIASVPLIDKDTLYDIANVASSCAIIVYDNLEDEKRKNNTTIDVNVTCRQDGQEKKFTYKYDISTIKNVKHQLLLIDSVYNLWIEKNYENAYNLFDEQFQALSTLENYAGLFNRASEELGQIKSYKLEGFDLVEMDIYGKRQKLIKYNTVSYRNEVHSIVFFLELSDKSKVVGINM